MTDPKKQQPLEGGATIISPVLEKSPQYSPMRDVTSLLPDQNIDTQASRQQVTSLPGDKNALERSDEERKQSAQSQTFSDLMNECAVDPANVQTTGDPNAVDLDELFGEIANESQVLEGSAYTVPDAEVKYITEMTSSEFNRFLDAAPDFFPDELFDPILFDVQAGQEDGAPQDVNQAKGEPLLELPDLSPDKINQAIGPFDSLAETAVDMFDFIHLPQAEPESKKPADAAINVYNFTNFPEAEPAPFPMVSPELLNLNLPVQQYPDLPPAQTYPPIPDETLGLPHQSGPHSYSTPLQNSKVDSSQGLDIPTKPHSIQYSKGRGLAQYLPQFPHSMDSRIWPALSPVKSSYAQVATPKPGFRALPSQLAAPQVTPPRVESPQILLERPGRMDLGLSERLQTTTDFVQPALADVNVDAPSPASQARVSPGSGSSSETSPDHPVVQRRKTSKPQLPKSLASNYYRIYREDENIKRAKIRGDNPDKQINPRTEKILAFKPEEHYTTLKRPPKPWDVFRYTDQGELQSNEYYSPEEIRRFLYENPQHRKKGLILWIQRKPADCGRRYPNYASQRCRFKDCAARHNLIGSGQYRVAFDQMSPKGKNYDPHYNAGYVHLYCLEKFLDFPKICRDLVVRAEDRNLPEEPKQHNNMALSMKQEVDFANSFVAQCKEGEIPNRYPHYKMRNRPHDGTLCHALSTVKVNFEPQTAKKRRMQRGTKTAIELHMGDLERETALSTRNAAVKKGKESKLAKRKHEESNSESEIEETREISEAESQRPQKRQRTQVAETAVMVAPQTAVMRAPEAPVVVALETAGKGVPDPPAGPMTRAKKRSIDEEAGGSSAKRRKF